MKRTLLPVLLALLLLPLCAQGAENPTTDLRAAPAGEGRKMMEEGLLELGLSMPPYELLEEDWNQQGLSRFKTVSSSGAFTMQQWTDEQDRTMELDAIFFGRDATEQDLLWAEEHLRDMWVLTLHTIYPDLSDEQAAGLIDALESNLSVQTNRTGAQEQQDSVRFGDYGFDLGVQEGGLGAHLQITYRGEPWGKALETTSPDSAEEPAPEPYPAPTVLYYNARGGRYYHATADQCPAVDPDYFPLSRFAPEELTRAPLSNLQPCPKCIPQP